MFLNVVKDGWALQSCIAFRHVQKLTCWENLFFIFFVHCPSNKIESAPIHLFVPFSSQCKSNSEIFSSSICLAFFGLPQCWVALLAGACSNAACVCERMSVCGYPALWWTNQSITTATTTTKPNVQPSFCSCCHIQGNKWKNLLSGQISLHYMYID